MSSSKRPLISRRLRTGLRLGPITVYSERRRCGKNCSGCPHGPYLYAKDHTGKRTYIGKEP
jgi:hypothetical protein